MLRLLALLLAASCVQCLHVSSARPVGLRRTACTPLRRGGAVTLSSDSPPDTLGRSSQAAAIAAGLAAQPIMWWSLYALKTTGCGVPAGPLGLFGAAEGISYLVVTGVVATALYKKVTILILFVLLVPRVATHHMKDDRPLICHRVILSRSL